MPRSPSRAGAAGRATGGAPLLVLVALLALVTLELVRSSGPLLDLAYSRTGVGGVAAAAVLTYLAPGPVAVLVLAVGRGSGIAVLAVGAGLVAGLRLLLQLLDGGARVGLGLVSVAVALAALTLAVAALVRCRGGRAAARTVSVGAAAGVGLQLCLGTWDAVWRHTVLGWAVAVVLALGLSVSALLVLRTTAVPADPVRRLWALGPYLGLAAMMLANPAFAAAQAGVPLTVAGLVHGLGLLVGGSAASLRASRAIPLRRAAAAAVLVLGVAAGLTLGGRSSLDPAVVLVALFAAQVAAARVLGAALERSPQGPTGETVLTSAGIPSLVGLTTIVPLLVYQVDYDLPLPVPNELVLVATAAGLALAGLRRRVAHPTEVERAGPTKPPTELVRPDRPTRPDRGLLTLWVAGCAVVLGGSAVSAAVWLDRQQTADATAGPGSGRVLSWNLHYGVSPGGSVELEEVARTIEAQDPDVVLLQEVSRGWVLGGGVDLATWLSNRLGRQFVFAPAADRRFGNAILSRVDPSEVRVLSLPYGDGPQQRSAVSARLPVGGTTLEVTSVHLQNRAANTPTRLRQVEALLAGLDDGAQVPRLVAGDLNAGPGSPEIARLTGAGFVSSIDAVGDPGALTSPSDTPVRRIDWVFGRGVTFVDAAVLIDARWSDHLPLVVALEP